LPAPARRLARSARSVGQQHLAAGQPREQPPEAALGAQQLGDLEVVRLAQEVVRVDAVVTHQAEHRRAVAQPVLAADPVGLGAVDRQVPLDVRRHPRVDRAEIACDASCSVSSRSKNQTGGRRVRDLRSHVHAGRISLRAALRAAGRAARHQLQRRRAFARRKDVAAKGVNGS